MNTDDMKGAADRAEARSLLPPAGRELILASPEEWAKEAKVKRAEALMLEKAASAARAKAEADAATERARAEREGGAGRVYEFRAGEPDDMWPEIKRNGEPVKGSMLNAEKAIERLKLSCRRDTFSGTYIVEGPGMGQFVGELNDALVRKFRELVSRSSRLRTGKLTGPHCRARELRGRFRAEGPIAKSGMACWPSPTQQFAKKKKRKRKEPDLAKKRKRKSGRKSSRQPPSRGTLFDPISTSRARMNGQRKSKRKTKLNI